MAWKYKGLSVRTQSSDANSFPAPRSNPKDNCGGKKGG